MVIISIQMLKENNLQGRLTALTAGEKHLHEGNNLKSWVVIV
jgi:hypothetical protein